MTDEEIKAIVAKYIIGNHESDNADCLHEMDEWQTGEESEQDDLNKGYDFYRSAKVTVTWDQPGDGGVREPSGDSPDSPAPGESRLPGEGAKPEARKVPCGDPGIDWPVLLETASYEAVWVGGLELQPDGTWDSWQRTLTPSVSEA